MRGSDCQAGGAVVSFLFCSPDLIVWTKLAFTNDDENTGLHFSLPLPLDVPLSPFSVSSSPRGKSDSTRYSFSVHFKVTMDRVHRS